MSQFVAGQAVTAKTMGRNPVAVEGTVKEVVASARGDWVVVTDATGKDHKTRPSLVTAK